MAPRNEDFEIAIICALPDEARAVRASFDSEYDRSAKSISDSNVYTTGQISGQHVVLAHMTGTGKVKAARAAVNLESTFPAIKVALVVGVCGAVPHAKENIFLGDVIISEGVVQTDFGRHHRDGFVRKNTPLDNLGPPPLEIRGLLAKMKSERDEVRKRTHETVNNIVLKLGDEFQNPGSEEDVLYDSFENQIQRQRRSETAAIHTGVYASSDTVMQSGAERDTIAAQEGIIAFEMEAAGVWETFPCLVIKSASDYADEHKLKRWQPYASVTAAACAKVLIERYAPDIPRRTKELDTLTKDALNHIYITNPRDDMARIEASKDNILEQCYSWVFEDSTFKSWCEDDDCRLLWISGDPGKGKTMLMMALVRNVPVDKFTGHTFFFCQSADNRLNSAVAVVRGLIWQLIDHSPRTAHHLRKEYEKIGSNLLNGPNAVYTLLRILGNMLKDSSLQWSYIFVDGLDECDQQQDILLKFIAEQADDPSSKSKWLVSSRNHANIREKLQPKAADTRQLLSLELNASHISRAVAAFISHKVDALAADKDYGEELRTHVKAVLSEKANSTFLWVSLACKELEEADSWEIEEILEEFPTGLTPLYERMMGQINALNRKYPELCRRILALNSVAYRPLHLLELVKLLALPNISNEMQMSKLVERCGSFLTIQNGITYFVHQSAKEYLLEDTCSIFGSDVTLAKMHQNVVDQSLNGMEKTLKKNLGSLKGPGSATKEADNASVRSVDYACRFWVDHLVEFMDGCDSLDEKQRYVTDHGPIHRFLLKFFLNWIEALALIGQIPSAVLALRELGGLVKPLHAEEPDWHIYDWKESAAVLSSFVHDALRSLIQCSHGIEQAPLQVYSSMLVFAPETSLIRQVFSREMTNDFKTLPKLPIDWSLVHHTLEGHTQEVKSVAFTPDGKLLASASEDKTVRLWDATTGALLLMLEGHTDVVHSVAFAPCGDLLASASEDRTVRVWDAAQGKLLQVLEGHIHGVTSVVFAPRDRILVSASDDQTIRVWETESFSLVRTLEGHKDVVNSVAFAPNGKRLASASDDRTIRVWDAASGVQLQSIECEEEWVTAIAYAPDSNTIASASASRAIKLWDVLSGELLKKFEGHVHPTTSVAFSLDGKQLASTGWDKTVRVWNIESGTSIETLEGHTGSVNSVAFAPDGRLASASDDNTLRIWDEVSGTRVPTVRNHPPRVDSVAFAPNGQLASVASDQFIRLWDAATGEMVKEIDCHDTQVYSISFAPDNKLASAALNKPVQVWDVKSGKLLLSLEGHTSSPRAVAFSRSGQLASCSLDRTVRLWDVASGTLLQVLDGHRSFVNSIVFSPDGGQIASSSNDKTVRVWDTSNGELLLTLNGHTDHVQSVAYSSDGLRLAAIASDKTMRVWDAVNGTLLRTLNSYHSRLPASLAFEIDADGSSSGLSEVDSGRRAWSLSSDRTWMFWKGRKTLWLPHSYRPESYDSHGEFIAVGCPNGLLYTVGHS